MEHAQLIRCERADNRVQNAAVVEENEILLFPVQASMGGSAQIIVYGQAE